MAAPKHVPPSINLKAFSCPHCGALADQTWFKVYASTVDAEDRLPHLMTRQFVDDLRAQAKEDREDNPQLAKAREDIADRFEVELTGRPLLHKRNEGYYTGYDLENLHVSLCYACNEISIWRFDTLLYPLHRFEIEPNSDMNEDIQADFNEARAVLDLSPRAAAALLRLCIQKLCAQVGAVGTPSTSRLPTSSPRSSILASQRHWMSFE